LLDLQTDFLAADMIGAGGIRNTSIALTAFDNDGIKQRFAISVGSFAPTTPPSLSCASPVHMLGRFSKVIRIGIENPKVLTPLRPFLSSNHISSSFPIRPTRP
jgi:hypothetical protein